MRVAAMRAPVRVLSPSELQAADRLAPAEGLAPADSLAPAQLGRRSTGNWRVGVGVIAGCVLGIVGYFATRIELGPSGAAGDGNGVSISGGETAPAQGLNQGPIVAPVTDAPNVLPILRDDAETPGRRHAQVRGPLVAPPASLRGSTADQSLEAELDHVGQAVSGLVDEADEQPPSDEELVEARYALAASKPKPSAGPEPAVPPAAAAPAPVPVPVPVPRPPLSLGSENSAGTPPALPKGPSRGAFPDASSP